MEDVAGDRQPARGGQRSDAAEPGDSAAGGGVEADHADPPEVDEVPEVRQPGLLVADADGVVEPGGERRELLEVVEAEGVLDPAHAKRTPRPGVGQERLGIGRAAVEVDDQRRVVVEGGAAGAQPPGVAGEVSGTRHLDGGGAIAGHRRHQAGDGVVRLRRDGVAAGERRRDRLDRTAEKFDQRHAGTPAEEIVEGAVGEAEGAPEDAVGALHGVAAHRPVVERRRVGSRLALPARGEHLRDHSGDRGAAGVADGPARHPLVVDDLDDGVVAGGDGHRGERERRRQRYADVIGAKRLDRGHQRAWSAVQPPSTRRVWPTMWEE
jgi:hypothetical protein